MILSGVLARLDTSDVIAGDMQRRNVSIVGYLVSLLNLWVFSFQDSG